MGLIDFRTMAEAAITSNNAMRWWIRDERKIDTGTTSAGNRVLVIKLACSTMLGAERSTVSWNRSQGSIPQNRNMV